MRTTKWSDTKTNNKKASWQDSQSMKEGTE